MVEKKKIGIKKKIYDICFFIYHSSKIDVQFLHKEDKLSFQLYYTEMPFSIKSLRKQTGTYIYKFFEKEDPTKCFYYTDSFELNYIGVGLWEGGIYQGAFIIGPFLTIVPNDNFIQRVMEQNMISSQYEKEVEQYYDTIPIFHGNSAWQIGHFLTNMAMADFKDIEVIHSQKNQLDPIALEMEWEDEHIYSEVEARFEIEKKIMDSVRKGDEEVALETLSSFYFDASHRMPDNILRVSKNLAFTYNTMLRIAAREGGVHPIYLHRTSDKFAILIEKSASTKDLEQLQIAMIKEYCGLVREVSTEGYSGLVRQAVDYINLNFSQELSLPLIAETINVSPSHLSKKFKKETGYTVTEFINMKRIYEAKRLLEKTDHSITDIAILIGFDDPGYFTSVFRKLVGMTPREYMKVCQKENLSFYNKNNITL